MKKSKGATVYDIAREAGVSAATVSRYLNGTAKVADDKLAHDRRVDPVAGVGLLQRDHDRHRGRAQERRLRAVPIVTGHWHADEEAERIELSIARRVDGLVILTGNLTDQQILKFAQRVPIVAFGRKLQGKQAFGFSLDNHTAACAAVEYLIQQGHRKIARTGRAWRCTGAASACRKTSRWSVSTTRTRRCA